MRKIPIEQIAISAAALLAALSCLGACGKDSSLHAGGDGGDGGGGGLQGGGGQGVAGQGAGGNGTGGSVVSGVGGHIGTGGSFPGIGGAFVYGVGGNGIGGTGVGGSGVAGSGAGGSSAGCAQVATQAACDASQSCYSVFFDPHTCSCPALGCCAHFHHCAEGSSGAQCYGGVSCALATPFCEGPYVVSYRSDCFEGCVTSLDCAPVCTPGADQTCNDNPIVAALHGHCTAAGTCQCNGTYVLNPNTGRCL